MKKAALEEALAYSNNANTFALEDTVERCYRDVVQELQAMGWTRVPYRKRSKVEKKKYEKATQITLFFTIF